jgi:hypothetical protein
VLYAIGGVLTLVATPVLWFNLDKIQDFMSVFGIPAAALVAGVAFLGVLALIAAVGMWRGKRWGWWLGAFYYSYSVARAAAGLAFVYFVVEQLDGDAAPTGADLFRAKAKLIGRIVVSSLLFLYFFKANVRDYFTLGQASRLKAAGILIAATIGLVVLFNLAMNMVQ